MTKPTGVDVHFSAVKLLLLAVRRTRAACSKTSSGHLDHLEWLPSCFSTMDLKKPESRLHTACIYCLVLVLSV